MIWWLIAAAYVGIGCWLVPRFTRSAYVVQVDRWSHQTKAESLRDAAFIGWAKSLIWPIALVIHIAVEAITAEERAAAAEKERAKTIEGAKQIIARHEEEEKRKWTQQYIQNEQAAWPRIGRTGGK